MIIDSSICVATITGRPSRRAVSTMRFCIGGTVSGGNSTPRSPRATITPSHCSMISSKPRDRGGLLDLASSARLPADQPPRLHQVLGPLDEAERDPVGALLARERQIAAVLVGQRRQRQHHVGDVEPLVVRQDAADLDQRGDPVRRMAEHAQNELAVVEQQPRARLGGDENLAVRQLDAIGIALARNRDRR